MEAPDRSDRVRPLPPEHESDDERFKLTLRNTLPLGVGAAVLAVFVAVLALGGSGDPGAEAAGGATTTVPPLVRPPEESTSTTIATPTTIVTRPSPELQEVLPAFVGGLNAAVVYSDNASAVARWRPDRRFPIFTDIADSPGLIAFDASGTLVAHIGAVFSARQPGLLSVGTAPRGPLPVFVEAHSMRWHNTQTGVMAITGKLPTEETSGVYLITVDGFGSVSSTVRITDAGSTWIIVGFHGDRLLIMDTDGLQPIMRVIDVEGSEVGSWVGFPVITTDDYIIGGGRIDNIFSFLVWTWDLEVVDVADRPDFATSSPPDAVSRNGRHGARLVQGVTSTVVVDSVDFAVPRSTGVPGFVESIFFVTDDHVAAFVPAESTLHLIEWRTGSFSSLELVGVAVAGVAAPGYVTQTPVEPTPIAPPADDATG